jgi:hypothetical protein
MKQKCLFGVQNFPSKCSIHLSCENLQTKVLPPKSYLKGFLILSKLFKKIY